MPVLVINCGSTSIKAAIVDPKTGRRLAKLHIERLGLQDASAAINGGAARPCSSTHAESLAEFLPEMLAETPADVSVMLVGHRVVHGGTRFTAPTLIDDEVVAELESLESLAPLHNPANVAGIRAARQLLPSARHVAVFDTAFHGTLPRRARAYAIPQDLAGEHNIRRFGFHGTSHQFVARRAAEFLSEDPRQLRMITCHLGGGCSICAVEYGRSIETSMGMTPLEGLVMGTRSGDVDPGALLHLMRSTGMNVDQLDDLLNHRSGLAGLSRRGNDLRDIEHRAEHGDEDCQLAIQVFCHRLRKYIGAYAAIMGGVDAIVFTGGIGENSAVVRHRAAQRLEFLGAHLDEHRNRGARASQAEPVAVISANHSRVCMMAIHSDESWSIARQARELLRTVDSASVDTTIPVAISARHVHLRQMSIEALFGAGHQLTPMRALSQPGQFAAVEEVTLVGPKRRIEGVRVLGPARSRDQVEISRTDEFFLGIDAPVRASGDVDNSPGISLIGTEGRQITIDQGVICAWRHIHMSPNDAENFEVADGDIVDVEVGANGVRSLTFGDVLIRVSPDFVLEMHIDTDEGNAAELERRDVGVLTSLEAKGVLRKSTRTR